MLTSLILLFTKCCRIWRDQLMNGFAARSLTGNKWKFSERFLASKLLSYVKQLASAVVFRWLVKPDTGPMGGLKTSGCKISVVLQKPPPTQIQERAVPGKWITKKWSLREAREYEKRMMDQADGDDNEQLNCLPFFVPYLCTYLMHLSSVRLSGCRLANRPGEPSQLLHQVGHGARVHPHRRPDRAGVRLAPRFRLHQHHASHLCRRRLYYRLA